MEQLMLYLSFDFLGPHLVHLGILMILALSLNMINGHAGLFSIGHAGFMCAGAYGGGAFAIYCLGGAPAWAVLPAVACPLSWVSRRAAAGPSTEDRRRVLIGLSGPTECGAEGRLSGEVWMRAQGDDGNCLRVVFSTAAVRR